MIDLLRFDLRLALLLLASVCLSSISASQQPNRTATNSGVVNNKKMSDSASAPEGIPKIVDLSNKLIFSLTLDELKQPQVVYKNSEDKVSPLPSTDLATLEKLVAEEFKEPNSLDGVVIRVANNVKYDMVTSLLTSVRAAMSKNKIDKLVYISVQGKSKQDVDEIRTQEFVCKNKKAADLYDRVSLVARTFKVSVRLDPARNSITAKGPSSKVKAIQNLITYLDKPAGIPNAVPGISRPNTPPSNSGNAKAPKKSVTKTDTDNNPKQNTEPIRIQPNTPANEKSPQAEPPTASSTVGRYQIAGIGDNLFMLDTATGESWFLDATQEQMRWVKLPHPKSGR